MHLSSIETMNKLTLELAHLIKVTVFQQSQVLELSEKANHLFVEIKAMLSEVETIIAQCSLEFYATHCVFSVFK